MTKTSILGAFSVVLSLMSLGTPAEADEMDPPSTDELAAPSREELARPEPEEADEPASERHWHVGVGLVPHVWMPANNPASWRVELEGRWTPSVAWSVVADVSYVQIGESGSRASEDGIGLFAGAMHEWAIGERETASLFPHVRAGLAFEATSTRTDVSAKHIALRFGPGIDWNIAGPVRLNLGLEIGFGLLAIKAGSEGDQALAELTLGLALRFLWGF